MERRQTPREPTPGHVWWHRLEDVFPQQGWMADRSQTGIAFVTPFAKRLREGETIAVRSHQTAMKYGKANTKYYTVRRVEPYDEKLTLVACRAT